MNQPFADVSGSEESLLSGLSESQQTRLTELLDQYLESLESGQQIDANAIQQANPDLAVAFGAYLEKLDSLYGVAVGFQSKGSDDPTEFQSGTTLGEFTIHREIGRGGMGVVYEASQSSLERQVAIKLLPLASLLDSNQIARFKNEAHSAGLLNHPNIVPIYSVGKDRGIHYFAMQYIDGISMDAWCNAKRDQASPDHSVFRGDDEWMKCVRWAIDAAHALQHAHENGVIHRDIKPSNLMLDQQGKIWITDFGLARCQSDASLTRSGDVIGTMRYMSPEQANGQSALVDGRADIYSLAATLYEMLLLRPAFQGDDAASILRKIDASDVTPVSQLRPDLPRDISTVIAKAMSKNRDDRYLTAQELADDLERVVRGEPTHARPPSMADRISRMAAKHRSVVLAGALVVGLGLIGSAVSLAQLSAAKRASDASAVRAAQGEKLARDAVDRLGAQTAELLSEIPAAASVRKRLLWETLDYYKRFAGELSTDGSFQQELAVALGKIGSIQLELGDHEQAIASLTHSEAIYETLCDRPSVDTHSLLDWSKSRNNLGQAFVRVGRLEDAARLFTRAIIAQRTLIKKPDQSVPLATIELALATTLNNQALLLANVKADEQAEASFLEAIELLSHSTMESDVTSSLKLDSVRANLAGLLTRTSPERAIQYAKDALAGQLDSLEIDRSNTKLATQTVSTLNTLGAAQSAANQHRNAKVTLHRAIQLGNELVESWPDHATHRRDLVISYNHLGLSHSKMKRLSAARDSFSNAYRIGQPLADAFPSDAETQSLIASVLNNVGFLQQEMGNTHEAAKAYRHAIERQSNAVRLAPQVRSYQQFLSKHQENLQRVVGDTTVLRGSRS